VTNDRALQEKKNQIRLTVKEAGLAGVCGQLPDEPDRQQKVGKKTKERGSQRFETDAGETTTSSLKRGGMRYGGSD